VDDETRLALFLVVVTPYGKHLLDIQLF